MAKPKHDTSPMLSVCAGQVCIGHIFTRDRGKSFEAYDVDDKLLGNFASQREAANAISSKYEAAQ